MVKVKYKNRIEHLYLYSVTEDLEAVLVRKWMLVSLDCSRIKILNMFLEQRNLPTLLKGNPDLFNENLREKNYDCKLDLKPGVVLVFLQAKTI